MRSERTWWHDTTGRLFDWERRAGYAANRSLSRRALTPEAVKKGDPVGLWLLFTCLMVRRQAGQGGVHVLPGAEGGARRQRRLGPRARMRWRRQLHGATRVPQLASLPQPHHELFSTKNGERTEGHSGLHNVVLVCRFSTTTAP